jgi:hypothetical protein
MITFVKYPFAKNIIIYSLPIGYFYGCYNLGYYSEKIKYNLYNKWKDQK